MTPFSNILIKNKEVLQPPNIVQQFQQNSTPFSNPDSMTPLGDPQYLVQNAYCFKHIHELSKVSVTQKSKKDQKFEFTNQFIFGTYMPPCYSVLNFPLMKKLVTHIKNSNAPVPKLLTVYKEIIDHERELFLPWLSSIWEENLKNRRLNVIPHVENYIKSAYNFSNSYIKSHYNGTYTSKMKIDYNREKCELSNEIKMEYCQRVKKSDFNYAANFPTIDIKNVESKISFQDSVYNPPQKSPFINDELCRTLSQSHCCDTNICLSSIKHIMNLEKPNSVWIIPVNIKIDADNNRKTVYIGGALSTGHFSQQEKCLYYLRKEIKKKFRKPPKTTTINNTVENSSEYNYDKWILNYNETNSGVNKSFNILVRNKPHSRLKNRSNNEQIERVFMPKVEYQPEFGFEKLCKEQLSEYWLDTHFRNPNCKMMLVSVQYNMDIMMIRNMKMEHIDKDLDDIKQTYLQRLYVTLNKLSQLDKGEYILLHNPKKPFQVELYQSSIYGGFNLVNMYYVLQQTEVSDSLAWNPIDPEVICPIHEHFEVAPCMFRPNPVELNVQIIREQANKFKTVLEFREKIKKEKLAKKMKIKKEKNKIKQKLKRADDNLFQIKRQALNE